MTKSEGKRIKVPKKGQVAIWNRMIKEGITEKAMCEPRPAGGKKTSWQISGEVHSR